MRILRTALVAGMLVASSLLATPRAQAQVFIGPPVIAPPLLRVPAVAPVPAVRPLVTPYRASYRVAVTPVAVPIYTTPYMTTRPVVVTPVGRTPLVPFQPVRNAIRLRRPF